MNRNEILRTLRKILSANEVAMAKIYSLGGNTIDSDTMRKFLRHENDKEFEPCDDPTLACFLTGLIVFRRGESRQPDPSGSISLSNNQILKKLRIAFELHDNEMHLLFEQGNCPISKQELKSLFRHPEHKNFIPCTDKQLRYFMQGLTIQFRPKASLIASADRQDNYDMY